MSELAAELGLVRACPTADQVRVGESAGFSLADKRVSVHATMFHCCGVNAIFVIENNLYGEYSPIASTTANTRLADRAASYAMPGVRTDGNDVVAMLDAARRAVQRARDGHGPTLIEAMTYRQSGHSRSDPAKYRPAGELEQWLARDPVIVTEQHLRRLGASDTELAAVRDQARADVDAAAQRALSWPDPDPADRLTDVWTS